MGSGTSCIKYLMFFFNLLIFLGGAALLGLGIWVAVNAKSFADVVSDDFRLINSAYVIIAVGGALLLIGFFGCCGAIKENKCLLGTFFTVVLILFIVEVVGAILAFVFYPQAEEAIVDSIQQYNKGGEHDSKAAWDNVQETFKCCGWNGAGDYNNTILLTPTTCCKSSPCTKLNAYKGCKETFQVYFWVIGGVAFGVLLIELLAMIFACCIYRSADGSGGYA